MADGTKMVCPICASSVYDSELSGVSCDKCGFPYAFIRFFAGDQGKTLWENKVEKCREDRAAGISLQGLDEKGATENAEVCEDVGVPGSSQKMAFEEAGQTAEADEETEQAAEAAVESVPNDYEDRPIPVKLISANVTSERMIEITLDNICNIGNAAVDLYDMNVGMPLPEKEIYDVAELATMGAKIGSVPNICAKTLELIVPGKKEYRICAVTLKGERVAVSNCLSCSNYEKVRIHAERTEVVDGDLYIYLQDNLPPGLIGIRYAVDAKNDDGEPDFRHGVEDAHNMARLPIETYRSDGTIIYRNAPKKILYVSVIGEYMAEGGVHYSNPSNLRLFNKPKMEISYEMAWGILGRISGRKKKVKLIIKCNVDARLPEMLLCCHRTAKIPTKDPRSDPDSIILCKVPEDLKYMAGFRKEIEIPDDVWEEAVRGNEVRLFLSSERNVEFKVRGAMLTIP